MEALKELFEGISPRRQVQGPTDNGDEDVAPTRRAETVTSHVASEVDPMAQETPEERPSARPQRSQAGSSRQEAQERGKPVRDTSPSDLSRTPDDDNPSVITEGPKDPVSPMTARDRSSTRSQPALRRSARFQDPGSRTESVYAPAPEPEATETSTGPRHQAPGSQQGGSSEDHASPSRERRSEYEDDEGEGDQGTRVHEEEEVHGGPYEAYEEASPLDQVEAMRVVIDKLKAERAELRQAASMQEKLYEADRAKMEQVLHGLSQKLDQVGKGARAGQSQPDRPLQQDASSRPTQPKTSQTNGKASLRTEVRTRFRQEEMKPNAVTDRPGSLVTHVRPQQQAKVEWWDLDQDSSGSEGADYLNEESGRAEGHPSYTPPETSGKPTHNSSASEFVSVLKYMQDQQVSMEQARRQEMAVLVQHLADSTSKNKSGKHEDRLGVPPKLRTEGQPKWPSSKAVYPFCIFAEDFKAWIALLGLDEIIEKSQSDLSVSLEADTLLLRYIAAAMTNSTIATHVSSNFQGKGRAAWHYLNEAYGLPSIGQSALRQNIEDLKITSKDDPRVTVIMLERLCSRLDPPMTKKEMTEHLLLKLPREWMHIGDGLRMNFMNNMEQFDKIKEQFIFTINEQRKVLARQRSYRGEAFSSDLTLVGTGPPNERSQLEHENHELRRSLLKTTGARVGGKKATYNRKGPGDKGGRRDTKSFGKENTKPSPRPNYKGKAPYSARNGKAASDVTCVNCGKKGHYLKDCPRPPVKCSHPACGKQHLDKFCYWQHPELLQNPSRKADMMKRIKEHNSGKRDAMILDYGSDEEDPQIFSLELRDIPSTASKGSCKDLTVLPEKERKTERKPKRTARFESPPTAVNESDSRGSDDDSWEFVVYAVELDVSQPEEADEVASGVIARPQSDDRTEAITNTTRINSRVGAGQSADQNNNELGYLLRQQATGMSSHKELQTQSGASQTDHHQMPRNSSISSELVCPECRSDKTSTKAFTPTVSGVKPHDACRAHVTISDTPPSPPMSPPSQEDVASRTPGCVTSGEPDGSDLNVLSEDSGAPLVNETNPESQQWAESMGARMLLEEAESDAVDSVMDITSELLMTGRFQSTVLNSTIESIRLVEERHTDYGTRMRALKVLLESMWLLHSKLNRVVPRTQRVVDAIYDTREAIIEISSARNRHARRYFESETGQPIPSSYLPDTDLPSPPQVEAATNQRPTEPAEQPPPSPSPSPPAPASPEGSETEWPELKDLSPQNRRMSEPMAYPPRWDSSQGPPPWCVEGHASRGTPEGSDDVHTAAQALVDLTKSVSRLEGAPYMTRITRILHGLVRAMTERASGLTANDARIITPYIDSEVGRKLTLDGIDITKELCELMPGSDHVTLVCDMKRAAPPRRGKTTARSTLMALGRDQKLMPTPAWNGPRCRSTAMCTHPSHVKKKWDSFIVDSGANISVCNNIRAFVSLQDAKLRATTADGHSYSDGVGTIRVQVRKTDGTWYVFERSDVFYFKNFNHNLLSVYQEWTNHGTRVMFGQGLGLLLADGTSLEVVTTGPRFEIPFEIVTENVCHGLTTLSVEQPIEESPIEHPYFKMRGSKMPKVYSGMDQDNDDELVDTQSDQDKQWLKTLHSRFGHMTLSNMKKLPEAIADFPQKLAERLKALPDDYDLNCEVCAKGRMHKMPQSASKTTDKFTAWGHQIHSDLTGPLPISFETKDVYAICFVDTFTKWISVYSIPDKTGETIASAFATFLADTAEHGPVLKIVTDGGREYDNKIFRSLCLNRQIRHYMTMPYESDSNGRAERVWSTLLPIVRCMLSESGVGHHHWPCAFRQAAFVHNITPRKYSPQHQFAYTPYYMARKQYPNMQYLVPFGCLVHARVADKNRVSKLDEISVKGWNMGPHPDRRGWLVLVPGSGNKYTGSRHIVKHSTVFKKDREDKEHDNRAARDESAPQSMAGTTEPSQERERQPGEGPPPDVPSSPPDGRPRTGNEDPPSPRTVAKWERAAGQERARIDGRHTGRICGTPGCTLPDGHAGAHSFERFAGPDWSGKPSRNTRASRNRAVHESGAAEMPGPMPNRENLVPPTASEMVQNSEGPAPDAMQDDQVQGREASDAARTDRATGQGASDDSGSSESDGDDDGECHVKSILRTKWEAGQKQYLISWKGDTQSHSWIAAEKMQENCMPLVEEYERKAASAAALSIEARTSEAHGVRLWDQALQAKLAHTCRAVARQDPELIQELVGNRPAGRNYTDWLVRHDRLEAYAIAQGLTDKEPPNTREQMLGHADVKRWLEAEEVELASLRSKGTFGEEIPESQLPSGQRPLSTRYVYTYRMKEGKETCKGRLVVRGNHSKFGVDWSGSHAETLNLTTLRTLMAITATKGNFHYRVTDIKSAFVTAPLDRLVYIRPAPGQPQFNSNGERIVIRLKKALYGLVDSARRFTRHLREILVKIGFTVCPVDPCLFRKDVGNDVLFVAFYIDDGLFASSSLALLERVYEEIASQLECTPLEELSTLLGMQFTHDKQKRCMWLSQGEYIKMMSKKYLPEGHKSQTMPCSPSILELTALDKDDPQIAKCQPEYRSIVGSLNWVGMNGRPDIAIAISILSRFLHCPGENHLKTAKGVVAYLDDTSDLRLKLGGEPSEEFKALLPGDIDPSALMAWGDSSWGDEKPQIGGVATVHGTLVHWFSRRSNHTGLSSTESELGACTKVCVEVLYLREICAFIEKVDLSKIQRPTPIFTDNRALVYIADGDISSIKRTKHCIRSTAFLKENAESKAIVLGWVNTLSNLADCMTKPLVRKLFDMWRRFLVE